MEHKPKKEFAAGTEEQRPGNAPQPAVVWESKSTAETAPPDRGQVSDLSAYRERKEAAAPDREATVTRWALPGRQKGDPAQWLIMVSSGFGAAPAVIHSGRGGAGDVKACLAA
ncbi:hypothetical protein [Paenibacillus mucilaginosus]|uniref:Uncharacterized protein n=2 Tax=Paenibacillus mucilaginosus TaxID=61624 RepID=H6NJI2_9BACL|nr:hypothetical protein [Paenibacillus mucilaginosus]AEI41090.1 hypothetical protein KNP414_02529 [Paenibacillus mucilaginosus KNP414]AFC29662.1 hypothetical protein PM3016_2786 [Paenibacillus mucilaginosus 3016]MCG7211470.1 hypothetical protein [Paenibacillus mucilaginosus]WDM30154.1 hypothetical protein KCX80_13840 [Paenibacillus mucilaginosus]WFA18341.1 hypothetical protein ERY13_14210 [Paenibacillus mucilaginosus]